MLLGRTLWDLLERRVDETPDALMAVDEDMRTITFAEFWSEAELAAAGLAASGVRAGQVVTWQLPTWIESLVLIAALARLDVVQHPVAPGLDELELERLTDRVGTDLLVVPSTWRGLDHEEMATSIARRHGSMRVLVADRALPQGDPTTLGPLPADVDESELPARWLFHTAGHSGEPTVVQHTDATLAAAARSVGQRLGLIPYDRNGLVFPIADVMGIVWLLASLQSGCANVLSESTDPQDACDVLSREGATLAGPGTAHHRAYLEFQRCQLHPVLPDVRAFLGWGTPSPPELVDELRSAFEIPVLHAYGLVEAPVLTMVSNTDPHERVRLGAGTPMPGVEIRLIGLDGAIAAPGDVGEVRVRAPQLMRGYLDPSLQADSVDDDGFFRTGDLARFDEHGDLAITGTLKDVIVSRDDVVSARELEELLHRHDRIADAVVIGLPDPDAGERVCAVIQVAGDERLTFDDVIVHLRDSGLVGGHLPEQVEIVDSLPRDSSGTVLRHVLRDEFKG
jgi:acyl-CoA synthetase (AMP-forming)/AMP-acid ligase II